MSGRTRRPHSAPGTARLTATYSSPPPRAGAASREQSSHPQVAQDEVFEGDAGRRTQIIDLMLDAEPLHAGEVGIARPSVGLERVAVDGDLGGRACLHVHEPGATA